MPARLTTCKGQAQVRAPRSTRTTWIARLAICIAVALLCDSLPAPRFATEGFDAACATLRIDSTNPAARILYAGFRGASSSIVKYSLPAHERLGSLYFDSSDGAVSDIAHDVSERALLVAMLSGRIIRVDTATFTRTQTLQLGRPDGASVPAIFDYTGMYMALAASPLGGQAFAAAEDRAWRTRIVRLDTRGGALDVATGLNLTADAAIAAMAFLPAASGLLGGPVGGLEGTLFAATVVANPGASGGSAAAVARIAVSPNGTMTLLQRVLLASNEQPAVAMVLDPRGGALFLCLRNFEPAYVLRLRMGDLQRTHTDELPPIYHVPYAAALEPVSRRLYVATLSPPIDLITYDADSLTRLDERSQATITSTLELATSLTIDPIGGLMYIGLATSPAAIYALSIGASTGDAPTLRTRLLVGATDGTTTLLRGGGAMVSATLSQVPLLPGNGHTVMLLDAASNSLWSARGRHGVWELDAGSLSVRTSSLSPLLAPAAFDSGTYDARFDAPFVPGSVLDAANGFIYAATCSEPMHLHRYRIPGLVLDRVVTLPTQPGPFITKSPAPSCAMQPMSGSFLLHAPQLDALLFFYYNTDAGAASVVQISTATLEPVISNDYKYPFACPLHMARDFTCNTPVNGLAPQLAIWAGAMVTSSTAFVLLGALNDTTAASTGLSSLVLVQLSIYPSNSPIVSRISLLQRPDPALLVPTLMIRASASASSATSAVQRVWLIFTPADASTAGDAAAALGSSASSAAIAIAIDTASLQPTGRNVTLPEVGVSGLVASAASPSRGGMLAVGSRGLYLLPDAPPSGGATGSSSQLEQAPWQDLGEAGSKLLANDSIVTAATWDETKGKAFVAVASGSAEASVTLLAAQVAPGSLVAAPAPSTADATRPARRSLALPATAGPVFHSWVDSSASGNGDLWILGGLRRLMLQRIRASDFTLTHSIALSGLSQRIGVAVADTRRGLLYIFDTDFGNATLFRYAGLQPGETAGQPLAMSRSAGRRCAQAAAMIASQPIIVMASCSGWILVINVTVVGQMDVLYQSRRFDAANGYPELRVATVAQDTVFIASLQGSVIAVRPLVSPFPSVSVIKYLTTNTGVALKFIYGAMTSGDGANVYFASRTAPAYVARFAISALTSGSSTSVTAATSVKLPDGVDNIATCFVDTQPGQLFEVVVCGTASQVFPGFVAAIVSGKGAFASMTLASVPVPLRGQVVGASAWDQASRVAYLSTYVAPHRIYRFTFTASMSPPPPIIRSLLLSPNRGEGFLRAVAVMPALPQLRGDSSTGIATTTGTVAAPAAAADTHIALLGSALSPGTLVRVALPSRRRLDTLVLQDGEDFVSAVAVSSFATASSGAPSGSGGGAAGSSQLAYSAFVGTDNVGLGGLVPASQSSSGAAAGESDYVIQLTIPASASTTTTPTATMRRIAALALPAGFASVQFLLLDELRGHLWVGAGLAPGGLIRIDFSNASSIASSTMSIARAIPFPASASSTAAAGAGPAFTAGAGILDASRDCMYVVTVHSPPRLLRIAVPSGSITNTTILSSPLANARSLLLHPQSRMLLVGAGVLGSTAGGRIAVVDAAADWRSSGWLQQRAQLTLQAASAVEPDAIAALAADPNAPFVYAALDTEPPVIVQLRAGNWVQTAQFSLPSFTERPAALVLVPPLLGSQPGAAAMLMLTTAAAPSFAFVLQGTAATPLIRNATGTLGGLLPSQALCSRFGLSVRSACMFVQAALAGDASGSVTGAGNVRGIALDVVSFGHFLPSNLAARANVSIALTEANALQVSADSYSWSQLQLRGSVAAAAGSACASLACTDGDSCSCSLPASEVRAAEQALAGNATGLASSPLLALRYTLQLTVDDVPSPAFPIVLLSGAPRLLRVKPSIVAAHGASLTIDMALYSGFSAASDTIILRSTGASASAGTTGGAFIASLTLPCIVEAVSADQQSIVCRPPPLHRSLLGRAFDVVLQQAATAEAAVLSSAVQYAWPVLASVFPPVGLPPESGASPALNASNVFVTLDAPALLPNVQNGLCFAPAPAVRVWIGSSECANASFADACTASLRCIPPSGVGLKVPITVDVAWLPPVEARPAALSGSVGAGSSSSAAADSGSPGAWFNFSVVSVEALKPGLPVSVFDDRYTETPGRPRLGFVTDAAYEVPQATAVLPPLIQLYPLASASAGAGAGGAGGSSADVQITITGLRFPLQRAISVRQSGVAAADALVCSPAVSAGHDSLACSWTAASITAAALAAARAEAAGSGAAGSTSGSVANGVDAGGVLAGTATIALNISFQEPGWCVAALSAAKSLRVMGRPLLRSAARKASAPDIAEIAGAGFLLPADSSSGSAGPSTASVNVSFGRAPCVGVKIVSDNLLTCSPPSFEAAADGTGNADVRVVVTTAAGSSDLPQLPPVSFVYFSGGMGVRWSASTVQTTATADIDTVTGASLTLHSTAPLYPLPVAIVTTTRDASCRLLQIAPDRSTLAEQDVAAAAGGSTGAGTNISFPSVALSTRLLAPFTAELQVRCAESTNAVTSEPLHWPVAAPIMQWSEATVDAIRSRGAFLPDAADTPAFALNVSIGVGDAGARLVRSPAAALVYAQAMSRLLCSARITLAGDAAASAAGSSSGSIRGLAGSVDGAVAAGVPPLQAALAGFFEVRFPGLSLASFPIGSQLTAAAECLWADSVASGNSTSGGTVSPPSTAVLSPTAASFQLPQLSLRVINAAVAWLQPAPPIMESQVYAFPPPIVALRLAANSIAAGGSSGAVPLTRTDGSNWTFSCEMDAALKAASTGSAASSNSTDAAGSGASDAGSTGSGAVSMIVIKQSVQAPLPAAAVFRAFAVSGRRRAQFTVTARCYLGSQPLPPLSSASEIAGCPRGQAPSNVTGWTCVECPTGSWTNGGDTPCQPCPASGAECSGAGVLRLLPGYWRPAKYAAASISADSALYQCLNPDACLLNESAPLAEQLYSCNEAAGHTGMLCGECLDGYARSGIKCARCAAPGANALALVAIIAAICAAALWFGRIAQPQQREPLSLAVRTLVGFIQSLSVVTAFKSNAAALVREVVGWTDTANDAVMTVGPISCLLRPSFLARLLMTVSLPLLLTLLVAVLASVIRHRELKQKRRRTLMRSIAAKAGSGAQAAGVSSGGTGSIMIELPARPTSSESAGPDAGLAAKPEIRPSLAQSQLPPPQQRRPVARLRDRMVFALTAVASLTYMPVITACVKALECVGPVEGARLLYADLSVECGGTEQRAAAAVAWTVLFVFGLGFPVTIVAVLYRYATAPLCGLRFCSSMRCCASSGSNEASGGRYRASLAPSGQAQLQQPSGRLWMRVTRRKDRGDGRSATAGAVVGKATRKGKTIASPSLSPAVTVIIPAPAAAAAAATGNASARKGQSFAAGSSTSTAAAAVDSGNESESPVPVILRPLADGYSHHVVYWEAVLLLRKGLLALVGALVTDPLRGLALFALIVAASHLLNAYARPYEDVWFNAAESLSLSATLAIALLSLMYAPGEPSTSATNAGVTAAIGIVMAATLAFLLWLVLRSASDAKAVNTARSTAARGLRKLQCCPACTRFADRVVEPRKSRVSASAVAAAARLGASADGAAGDALAGSSAPSALSVRNPLNAAAAAVAAASAAGTERVPSLVASGAADLPAVSEAAMSAAGAAAAASSGASAAAPAAAFIRRLVARYSMSGARAAAAFGPTQVLGSNGRGLPEEEETASASAWTANPLGNGSSAAAGAVTGAAATASSGVPASTAAASAATLDSHSTAAGAASIRPPPAFALPPIAVRAPPPRPRTAGAAAAASATAGSLVAPHN